MEFNFNKIENNKELKNKINERLNELYSKAPERKIVGFESMSPLKGIIPKETIIDNGGAYFCIKRNEYIYEFIDILKENNIKDLNQILNNIYNFINYYFGKNGDGDRRSVIFNQHSISKDYPDISVLKKQNAAMCSERAALAQNIFSFFGIESYYITGEVNTNRERENHAFNIIKYNNKMMIYDSSLDVPLFKGEKIVGYRHYLQEINQGQSIKEISYGNQFETSNYYFKMQNDGKWSKVESGKRYYSSGFLEREFER